MRALSPSSDGWTTDDLVFLWKEGDPVQVVKNLHLPRFTLEKFLTDYCNSKTNTGRSPTKITLLHRCCDYIGQHCSDPHQNVLVSPSASSSVWLATLCRRIQLPQSRPPVQARVLVLPYPDLYSLLHVGNRVLGVLLAGPGSSPRPCVAR